MYHSENNEQQYDDNTRNGRCILDHRPHRPEYTHLHVHRSVRVAIRATRILSLGADILSLLSTCILLPCHVRPYPVLFRSACGSGTVSYRSTARTYSPDRRTSGSHSGCRGCHDPFLARLRIHQFF